MNDALHEAAHARAAYQAMAEEAVDVVHDHTLLGPLVARATGFDTAPVVVTNHSPFGAGDQRPVRRRPARSPSSPSPTPRPAAPPDR